MTTRLRIGETQFALLREAAAKPGGQLMIDPLRDNARWCSMKRLCRRSLFIRYEFYAGTVVYTITDAGRQILDKILAGR